MRPDELAAARKRLGLTQPQLAKILDVNPRTISRWEVGAGEIPKPIEFLIRLWVQLPEALQLTGIETREGG